MVEFKEDYEEDELALTYKWADILPDYWNLRKQLRKRYEEDIYRKDGLMEQAQGSSNFVRTLDLTIKRIEDAETIMSIYKALEVIVDTEYSGRKSWEMRRFIRRAPVYMIKEFGELIEEMFKVNPKLRLGMDFYYWDIEWMGADAEKRSRKELDLIRQGIELEKEKISHS